MINPESDIKTDTQHGEENRIKLEIVRKIITLLGFKNATDEKIMSKDEFDFGLINLIGKSEIFTDEKMVKIYFEMSKSTIDTSNSKSALRYINEILKHYSIKIQAEYNGKKIDKNKVYRLCEIANVSEIVEYLVYSQKIKAFDGMRMPDKYLYSDCLLKYHCDENHLI